jgi:hypothetical protein
VSKRQGQSGENLNKRSRRRLRRVLKEDPWHEGDDVNSMWMEMDTYIRKVTSEEFGVTNGGMREAKKTLW